MHRKLRLYGTSSRQHSPSNNRHRHQALSALHCLRFSLLSASLVNRIVIEQPLSFLKGYFIDPASWRVASTPQRDQAIHARDCDLVGFVIMGAEIATLRQQERIIIFFKKWGSSCFSLFVFYHAYHFLWSLQNE